MLKKLQYYFGIQVNELNFNENKKLPLYLTVSRKLQKVEIAGTEFLIVYITDDDKYGVPALKKQLQKYNEITGLEIVFSFLSMSQV